MSEIRGVLEAKIEVIGKKRPLLGMGMIGNVGFELERMRSAQGQTNKVRKNPRECFLAFSATSLSFNVAQEIGHHCTSAHPPLSPSTFEISQSPAGRPEYAFPSKKKDGTWSET